MEQTVRFLSLRTLSWISVDLDLNTDSVQLAACHLIHPVWCFIIYKVGMLLNGIVLEIKSVNDNRELQCITNYFINSMD